MYDVPSALLAELIVIANSRTGQKLSVCVCVRVNQGGINHNHYS